MHVKAVYHRNDPLILGQPPVKPNYPGRQIKIPRLASLWDAIEAAGVPGIAGVWLLQGGGSRFIPVVSIKQMHAGHAKMAGLVTAGCRPGAYMARLVIVVDDDIDPTDIHDVIWAMGTRSDPQKDFNLLTQCWSSRLDTMVFGNELYNSRVVINACIPYEPLKGFPKVAQTSPELAKAVRAKYPDVFT